MIFISILFTAFNGKNNSSKILLDLIKYDNKLYVKNSFLTSVEQLTKELEKHCYDLVISFGQAPLKQDTIRIETIAKADDSFKTNYDYSIIKQVLESKYDVNISTDAGNYLCNNLYYHGLKYISENDLDTKMIFIHVPKIDNISKIAKLAEMFNKCNF